MDLLQRKPTFFTSDWHINHANSLKFDNRPFKTVEEMHRALIRNYNAQVPKNGICYFLGDIATGPTEIVRAILDQLNGTKVCIVGNHDKAYAAMYNCGFDVVLHTASIRINNQIVTMSHCPLPGMFRENVEGMERVELTEKWHGEFRQKDFTVPDIGQFHLQGHIHSGNGNKSIKILGRQMDVGVVANNFRPVGISQVESWISTSIPLVNDWRDIPFIPDYKINYFGEIKSFKRNSQGDKICPYKDKDGYLCVSLRANGKNKGYKVHRLVALAFLKNENDLPQINHKNGHKFDCSASNLEWISNIDNQRHAWRNDLKTLKLKVSDVKEIKKRLANGQSNTSIAIEFGVDQSLISNIKTGKIWNGVFENE